MYGVVSISSPEANCEAIGEGKGEGDAKHVLWACGGRLTDRLNGQERCALE
jgi:hypothetical protein